jgi:hypothetical protein
MPLVSGRGDANMWCVCVYYLSVYRRRPQCRVLHGFANPVSVAVPHPPPQSRRSTAHAPRIPPAPLAPFHPLPPSFHAHPPPPLLSVDKRAPLTPHDPRYRPHEAMPSPPTHRSWKRPPPRTRSWPHHPPRTMLAHPTRCTPLVAAANASASLPCLGGKLVEADAGDGLGGPLRLVGTPLLEEALGLRGGLLEQHHLGADHEIWEGSRGEEGIDGGCGIGSRQRIKGSGRGAEGQEGVCGSGPRRRRKRDQTDRRVYIRPSPILFPCLSLPSKSPSSSPAGYFSSSEYPIESSRWKRSQSEEFS